MFLNKIWQKVFRSFIVCFLSLFVAFCFHGWSFAKLLFLKSSKCSPNTAKRRKNGIEKNYDYAITSFEPYRIFKTNETKITAQKTVKINGNHDIACLTWKKAKFFSNQILKILSTIYFTYIRFVLFVLRTFENKTRYYLLINTNKKLCVPAEIKT